MSGFVRRRPVSHTELCFFIRNRRSRGPVRPIPAMRGTRNNIGRLLAFGGNIGGMAIPIVIGAIVQFTGSRFLELLCFAAMEVGRMICSRGIAYRKEIPV